MRARLGAKAAHPAPKTAQRRSSGRRPPRAGARRILLAAAASLALAAMTGCATTGYRPPWMDAFEASSPRSILVVPAVNHSLFVEAPNYLISSLTIPVADKGYYVFPVHTVKTILEGEGLYEPEKVRELEPAKLAAMFGADAVLYVTIVQWTTLYVVMTAQVTVELDYRMVDKRGVEIWKAHKTEVYRPQQASSRNAMADLITNMIIAAATRALPDYMPLVRKANRAVFDEESTALPEGPYLREVK